MATRKESSMSTARETALGSGAEDVKDPKLWSLLPILVSSGYVGIGDIGQLARTSSLMKSAVIDNDNIWASLYTTMYQMYEMSHAIPKEIIDKRGHRWLVRKFVRNSISEAPPMPLLDAPSQNENDLVIFGNLSYNPDKCNSELCKVLRGFSITGEKLRPLLVDGTVDTFFSTPIIVSGVKLFEKPSYQYMLYPGRVAVCPEDCNLQNIELRVRLLRLGDLKSCCVYEPNDTGGNFDRYPALRPVDRTLDPLDLYDLSIDQLDFEADTASGRINLFDGAAHRFEEGRFGTRGLPLQNSPQATAIKERFPYWFSFEANLYVNVSSEKKIVITGFSLEARKTHSDEDWCSIAFHDEGAGIEHRGAPNNGVTVAHVLSELYCQNDSDDITNADS